MPTQSSTPPPLPPPPFPLDLAIANLLTTGVALALAAANCQWSTHTPDALPHAWAYVNIAQLLATLALWPALSLSRKTLVSPLIDAATLIIATIPTLAIAALLSDITLTAALPILAVQLALILFTLGVLQWRTRIPLSLIAGTLTALATVTSIFAYLWPEFLLTAPQSWLPIIPALAVTHAHWWPAILYALIGTLLTLTAPRHRLA